MNKQRLIEELAAYSHRAWAQWMSYQFVNCIEFREDFGALLIPGYLVQRWKRQAATPYELLSEDEKKSGREEAEKIIAIVDAEQEKSNKELGELLKYMSVQTQHQYDEYVKQLEEARLRERLFPQSKD